MKNAEKAGIDSKRLICWRIPNDQHLKRVSLADIANLNKNLYGGTMTSQTFMGWRTCYKPLEGGSLRLRMATSNIN